MFPLEAIQKALLLLGMDGWLLAEFRGSNILARRVLELDGNHLAEAVLLYSSHGEPAQARASDRAGCS